MAEELKLELDPKHILQAMNAISEQTKKLSEVVEEALGKQAPKSIEAMKRSAEDGANSISSRFKDLGKRIKEDLKTAFNLTEVMGGLKLAESMGQGVKEVFSLERAFDKLNTRLQMTGKSFQDFKKNIGSAVAGTGQRLEDVFPGLETAAAKGRIKSPEELTAIAKALGQVKASTGESTEGVAESVAEILKTQGKAINATNFLQTLDALQATRTRGAFHTAGEAGQAIQGISGYGKQLGLNTRQMGGLEALASASGSSGQGILSSLLQKATEIGGAAKLNSILGQNIFRGGAHGQATGMDVDALKKVNVERFGSQQIMEQITGLTGSSGGDFKRFIQSMKEGSEDYKKVINGSNETATQFVQATNNLASAIDKFKQSAINATRTIGDELAVAAHDLISGDKEGAKSSAKSALKTGWENKGVLGATLATGGLAAILAGGGAGKLLKGLPGAGLAGGLAEGQALKNLGIQNVYVVNANEIGGGMPGIAAGGSLAQFALMGTAIAGGLMAGIAAGNTDTGSKLFDSIGLGKLTDTLMDALGISGVSKAKQDLAQAENASALKYGGDLDGKKNSEMMKLNHELLKSAIKEGTLEAHQQVSRGKVIQMSNPSRPMGGAGHQ